MNNKNKCFLPPLTELKLVLSLNEFEEKWMFTVYLS